MRLVKGIAFFLLFGVLTVAVSVIGFNHLFKKSGGVGQLAKSIEAIKLKSKYPAMPDSELQRRLQDIPTGTAGLIQALSSAQAISEKQAANGEQSSGPDSKTETVYISATQNKNVLAARQLPTDGSDAPPPKGVVEAPPEGRKTVQVSRTGDGREVVAVVENSFENPSAIDRINGLNISDELREKILQNYLQTGVLPEILVKESRKPAAAELPTDDPNNKKNW